ncbi:hypothetical protein G9A89_009258 [Geosiphon pyriformis]|nr:hypothetical protein G9A89_009258 [Geosiphon pyriformis]
MNDIVDKSFSDLIDKHCTFDIWHANGQIRSGYTSSASAMLYLYFIKTLHYQLSVAKRKRLYNLGYLSVLCIQYRLLEDSDYMFVYISNVNIHKDLILNTIKNWTNLLGVHITCNMVVHSFCEAMSLNCLYMFLFKDFVLKNWVAEAKDLLRNNSNSESLVINLVCHFAESHRFSVWLPRAKLRAYYEKHDLLPRDGFIILALS